jgi:catechol 2,3-dioxygenase-like lactoylglutathione lyase family enzyme
MAQHRFMTTAGSLAKYPLVAFATIVDVERAKRFYRDTLGLTLMSEEPPFALVFDANGTMVRLGMAKKLPEAHGTVLGWKVPEIEAAVGELSKSGVRFERFDGLAQDQLGIWASPTGAKVAWFRDPDGNILSISEHPEPRIRISSNLS